MAKKKKMGGKAIANILIAILLILSIVMLFVPNVVFDLGITSQSYSGAKIAFGYKEEVLGSKVQVLDFSFMAFLAYLLPVVGLLLSLLFKRAGSILSLILAVVILVGGIFAFIMPNFVIATVTGEAVEGGSLGVGAIILGIASILGALVVFGRKYLK